jgi:3-methylcrotonyl-CoA carboxylase alpha subunit
LLVVEAMKTEITLTAPADGVVDEVRAAVGEMVEEGVQLVTFR